jgi:hypothetical protein
VDTSTPHCTEGLVVLDGKCVPATSDGGPRPDAGSDAAMDAPLDTGNDGGQDASSDASDASAASDAPDDATSDASDAASTGGPAFAGVTSVSPASPTSMFVTWDAATDPATPSDQMLYAIYVAQKSMGEVYDPQHAIQLDGQTSYTLTGLTAGATYYVVVRATNKAGLQEHNTYELSAKAQSDTHAPTFPGPVSAIPFRGCQAKLSWPAAMDDLTGANGIQYQIYLADTPVDGGAPITTTLPGVTAITVAVPAAEANDSPYHKFMIVAVDAAGNASQGGPIGDTSAQPISFSSSIQTLVDNSCAPSCHTLNTTNKLTPTLDDGYAYFSLTGGPDASVAAKVCKPTSVAFCVLDGGDCPDWADASTFNLVEPGNAGCSVFYQVLNQTKMPPGVGVQPVSRCDVAMVHDWISQGANDN